MVVRVQFPLWVLINSTFLKNNHFVCGIRPIIEAIYNGRYISKLLLQYKFKGINIKKLFELIKDYEIPVQRVPREKLNIIAGKNNQGVLAFISPIRFYNINNIISYMYEIYGNPLILILDRVNDVKNFGAIVRTAVCTGVVAIIIPVKKSVTISHEMIKASSGAIFQIPICTEKNIYNLILQFKKYGFIIISTDEKANCILYNIKLSIPIGIVLGNEQNGITKEYLKISDAHVKIPILGTISSLNVSVTCGVILYEVLRQRLKYYLFKLV